MVPCNKCGAPNDVNASFCRSCGTAQPSASAGTDPAAAPPPMPTAAAYPPVPAVTKKKSKKALKIVGIVVALFIALVVWGALIDSGKKGGKGSAAAPESSESKPAAAPAPASEEDQAKDGGLICAEIQSQLKDYLKDSIKGIECKPGGETGGIALVVAYPLPLLAKDDLVRKNTLFMTFSIAGGAISRHTTTTVKKVYVLDSSQTAFRVPGEFAEQLYTKLVNNQLSQDDGKEEVLKVAQRGKIPLKSQ